MDFDAMREVDLGKVLETECSQSSTHFDVHRHYCTPSGLDVVRLDTCSIDWALTQAWTQLVLEKSRLLLSCGDILYGLYEALSEREMGEEKQHHKKQSAQPT